MEHSPLSHRLSQTCWNSAAPSICPREHAHLSCLNKRPKSLVRPAPRLIVPPAQICYRAQGSRSCVTHSAMSALLERCLIQRGAGLIWGSLLPLAQRHASLPVAFADSLLKHRAHYPSLTQRLLKLETALSHWHTLKQVTTQLGAVGSGRSENRPITASCIPQQHSAAPFKHTTCNICTRQHSGNQALKPSTTSPQLCHPHLHCRRQSATVSMHGAPRHCACTAPWSIPRHASRAETKQKAATFCPAKCGSSPLSNESHCRNSRAA